MTVSQHKKKRAIQHKQIQRIPEDGWTVVLKYADKPNQYVGWQTKERAQRELKYLTSDWEKYPDKLFGPIKISLKKLSYEEWRKLI